MSSNQRRRVVVETRPSRTRTARNRSYGRQPREGMIAVAVIAAAALATFLALFITSRPYDPMNSTVAPLQTVPSAPVAMQTSPKPTPTTTPSPTEKQASSPEQPSVPAGETGKTEIPDDTTIQAEIEKTIATDSTLSKLDVSTIVEGGKVTLVGSVGSADLKQRVEKAVRSVKGVVSINNQLAVVERTP